MSFKLEDGLRNHPKIAVAFISAGISVCALSMYAGGYKFGTPPNILFFNFSFYDR
jgi:hypothetical protein